MTDSPTDTRPRCGGTPGVPGLVRAGSGSPAHFCPGCADCPPAPDTQSGGRSTVDRAIDEVMRNTPDRWAHLQRGRIDALVEAVRAESSAAIQEARDEKTQAWLDQLETVELRAAAAASPVPPDAAEPVCVEIIALVSNKECGRPRAHLHHQIQRGKNFWELPYHGFVPSAAPGDGAFPSTVMCECGCHGEVHKTLWIEGTFHGTACDLHGGHKFTPADARGALPPDARCECGRTEKADCAAELPLHDVHLLAHSVPPNRRLCRDHHRFHATPAPPDDTKDARAGSPEGGQ